jgi:hypothetical protein
LIDLVVSFTHLCVIETFVELLPVLCAQSLVRCFWAGLRSSAWPEDLKQHVMSKQLACSTAQGEILSFELIQLRMFSSRNCTSPAVSN